MSDYWENRAAWDMYHAMEDAERTAQKIARIYRKALTQLTYAARDVFDKYRKDYGLSEVEAWELLNKMQDKASIDELLLDLRNEKTRKGRQDILKVFSYMPGTLKMLGDPRLDVWDIITVEDLSGESYKVPVAKLEWEYDGGLTYSIEAAGLSEDETNDSYKGPQTKEMERYYAQLVMIDTAMINKLDVDTAKITYATIKNLDVVKENVQEINGELGNFKNLTADKFTAIDAKITNLDVDYEKVGILEGEYANLKNVLMGNAGVGDLQNIHLTSENAVIDSALIRTAVMQTVSISDLLAGDISTNKFRILSDDGGILIQGATQQWKDADGIIRMQAGRDANGDFTFALFDKTGKGILLDSTGIKEGAIADGLIVNKMVSDDAAISANKLDIDSLFTTINNSVQTINSSRIWFDEKNQTLNQVYTQMSEDVESAKNEASNASQKMTSIETGLEGIRATLSETTSEVEEISDKTLIYNTQCTDNGDETTTISAVLYKAGKDITREYPEKNYSWRKKTESGQEFLGYGYEITVNNEDYMFGGTVVGRFTKYKQLALILNGKILILSKKAICFNVEE